jgi:hydroxymethylbilane synthase
MIERRLKIGSRGSKLATMQTYIVLKQLNKFFPELVFELKIIKTKGDKFLEEDFSKIQGKGIFTKEIEERLISGEIDIAVHSLKDLPTELPEELTISAILPRDNPEDVLISKQNRLFLELPEGAKIGTSSLRRIVQLKRIRPDFVFVPLRGNVPTRVKKLYHSDLDAIILARAGLERLGMGYTITEILPTEVIIPAVGQGAIAVEIRKDNDFAREITESLNNIETEFAVRAERAFLRRLGGGCRNPISAFATIIDYEIFIDGFVASTDGESFVHHSTFGDALNPEKVGTQLAETLLAMGARKILEGSPVNISTQS